MTQKRRCVNGAWVAPLAAILGMLVCCSSCAIGICTTMTHVPDPADYRANGVSIIMRNDPMGVKFVPPIPLLFGLAYAGPPYQTWLYVRDSTKTLQRVRVIGISVRSGSSAWGTTLTADNLKMMGEWISATPIGGLSRPVHRQADSDYRQAIFRSDTWNYERSGSDSIIMRISLDIDTATGIRRIEKEFHLSPQRRRDIRVIVGMY